MATDYAKKKNDELATLCKERGLAHTGKKADLVKRLEEYDATGGAAAAASAKPAVEDEIDWDDDPTTTAAAKAATSEPAANAVAASGVGQVPNPQAVPNQSAAVDPAQTDDLSVDPPAADGGAAAVAATEAEEKPVVEEKDYSSGIADRTLEEEIEKRKARARKFGMPEDSDEIKALERAKRFGTTDLPGMLNRALPTAQAKDRKRGAGAGGAGEDGGIRKRSRGPRGGRNGSGGGGRPRPEKSAQAGSGGAPSWMTDKDREAAERRRAKFATAS